MFLLQDALPDDAMVCPACGAYAEIDRQGNEAWYAANNTPTRRAVNRWGPWVVGAVVLVALLVAMSIAVTNAQDKARDDADCTVDAILEGRDPDIVCD